MLSNYIIQVVGAVDNSSATTTWLRVLSAHLGRRLGMVTGRISLLMGVSPFTVRKYLRTYMSEEDHEIVRKAQILWRRTTIEERIKRELPEMADKVIAILYES